LGAGRCSGWRHLLLPAELDHDPRDRTLESPTLLLKVEKWGTGALSGVTIVYLLWSSV
jgi:hypothetical protein